MYLDSSQAPSWARFPFINHGYRPTPPSTQSITIMRSILIALSSMLTWNIHNEWTNAWTMMVGLGVSFFLYTNMLRLHAHEMSYRDHTIFLAFFLSVVVHTPFSYLYHAACFISPTVKYFWLKMDLSFIFIASILLTISFSLYVFPLWMTIVLVNASAFVAKSAITILYKKEDIPTSDHDVKLMLLKLIAMIVAVYLFPIAYATLFMNAPVIYLSIIVSSLGIGAISYATCFPERLVDDGSVLNSSTLMHTMLVIAHIAEFYFLKWCFENL